MKITGIKSRKALLGLPLLEVIEPGAETVVGRAHFCMVDGGTKRPCSFFAVADHAPQGGEPPVECTEHGGSLISWLDLHVIGGRMYRWHDGWWRWQR